MELLYRPEGYKLNSAKGSFDDGKTLTARSVKLLSPGFESDRIPAASDPSAISVADAPPEPTDGRPPPASIGVGAEVHEMVIGPAEPRDGEQLRLGQLEQSGDDSGAGHFRG